MDALLNHEPAIRLGAFLTLLVSLFVLERVFPRRHRVGPTRRRVSHNLALVAVDTLVVRLLVPVLPVAVALAVEAQGGGLLQAAGLRGWRAAVVGIVLLDLSVWLQHVVFHHVPVLWRLHRLHHADVDLDVTSGARFHPIEILLSIAWKLVVVSALGVPAAAVVLFEVILNGMAMFNHANLALPEALDRVLRTVIVTPDFHRVHHSHVRAETDSNFGFNLSVWDHLLGTYRAQPTGGHTGMVVGLDAFRAPEESRIDRMLSQPFRDDRQTAVVPR